MVICHFGECQETQKEKNCMSKEPDEPKNPFEELQAQLNEALKSGKVKFGGAVSARRAWAEPAD